MQIPYTSITCLMAVITSTQAISWPFLIPKTHLVSRHEGHHNSATNSSESGTGEGHSMSHGAFNFTPSGIEWPTCLRTCCNNNFHYFEHAVNNPLCVSKAFFANVTSCVADNCTAYEQGAYAVVAEIECPAARGDIVNVSAAGVLAELKAEGGTPQTCVAVNNATITCENATATTSGATTSPTTTNTSGASSTDILNGLGRNQGFVTGVVSLVAVGVGYMLL